MSPFLRKILGMNWPLVLLTYGLLVFGVFMIESAARHLAVASDVAESFGGAGAYYAWMQKRWILVGSVVYFAVALIDYRWIRWLAVPFYLTGLALMVLAMQQDNSVHRLNLFGLSFQPAQLGTASGILMIAWLIQDLPKLHPWLGSPLIKIGIIGVISAIPFLMVMKMGDMGSALVWLPVAVVALIMAGTPVLQLSFMGFVAAGLLPLLHFIVLPMVSERGPQRIDTWLRMARGMEVDISNEGYAAHNVSMAVGKAGWKGVGWNAGTAQGSLHSKAFIPKDTAHNDYIFAVIAEELGFRGSLLLITAFTALFVLGLHVAFHSRDLAGRMIASMVVALFFAHVFESIGMCVLLTPITGIPMPLVSYSGTFVVVCLFMLGLMQSVWIHRHDVAVPVQRTPMPD
jgi:rod shape determining protein RodA